MAVPTRILLWTDAPAPYEAAIASAGLGPRASGGDQHAEAQ